MHRYYNGIIRDLQQELAESVYEREEAQQTIRVHQAHVTIYMEGLALRPSDV